MMVSKTLTSYLANANTIILNNPVTGITTTINGTGFAFAGPVGDEQPVSGTITSLVMGSNNNTFLEGQITGVNFSIVAFANSLDGVTDDNFQPFANLLNAGGPITIDGSSAPNGLIMFDLLPPELTGLITQPITVFGSGEFDNLYGGIGNDSIVVGADNGGFEGSDVEGTLGNDTIDFSNVSNTTFQFLDFEDFLNGPVTFNVDAIANTGTITGAGFTTTLVDPRRVMEADGLGLEGGESNDVFNIVNNDDSWFNLFGNEGNDTYNVEIGSGGRISFHTGSAFGVTPVFGLVADLSTGIVSNDGHGSSDTINVLSGDGRLEIRATDNNDSIMASDRNDSFITEQGNDTVDGGAGQDRVRYDRSGVDAVNVDLAAQTASGTWDGFAFTDTLISIEYVRGSREGDDTLSGAASDDRLEGRGGNDLIDGRAGDDELEGDAGNDTLIGGAGDDSLRGDEGNDSLIGGDGRDNLRGGDGDDVLDASGGDASTQGFGDYIRAGLGQDTILGHAEHWATGEGADISYNDLSGVGGLTIVSGVDGTGTAISGDGRVNDTFTFIHYFQGSQDADSITGAAEDRWEGFEGYAGNDTVDGGGGDARIAYNNEHYEGGSAGVTVDMGTGDQGSAIGTATDTFGDTDTLVRINQTRGSIFDDTISAANRTDDVRLDGDEGNDSIVGGTGNDKLEGGDGNDTLQGGLGDDDYFGEDGTDTAIINTNSSAISVFEAPDGLAISGSQGDDYIDNSVEFIQFNDTTLSFAAVAALAMGDQTLIGDGGNDELVGGIGNDSLVGNGGNDTLRGGDGDDSLRGGNGNNLLFDGQGNDSLIGGTGDDLWVSGGGEDTFNGGDGFDTVLFDLVTLAPQSFEVETNLATGDSGAVGFSGGRDVLISVEAVELIGNFNITVTGNDAANVIHTDLGTDSLIGGLGNDLLMAGAGNDTLVGNQGADTLLGENGDDVLDGGLDADSASGGNGNDTIFGGGGFDTLRGGNGDDTVVGGDGRDVVFLGGGDDLFVDNAQGGPNGADTVFANGGNDTIGGGAGNDRFEGQDGNDLLLGRLGNDVLFGGNQNDTIEGGDGNDTVAGGNGADRGFLGNGNDRWFDNAQEQFGNDFVVGGNGNDWIQAGGGNDTLAGGAGADTFVLAASINDDVITDYDVGTDDLDINAGLWNGTLNQARLDALTSVQNGNLVFDFDNGDSLTLNGVNTTAGLLGDIELI